MFHIWNHGDQERVPVGQGKRAIEVLLYMEHMGTDKEAVKTVIIIKANVEYPVSTEVRIGVKAGDKTNFDSVFMHHP